MNPLKHTIVLYLTLAASVLAAQESATGLIRDKHGMPFSGFASFKFMIASDSIAVWSNDGSVTKAEQPKSAVNLYIYEGEYVADLGMMPMKPLFQDLLKMYDNLKLLSWVDIGEGFVELGSEAFNQKQSIDFEDPTFYTLQPPSPEGLSPEATFRQMKRQKKEKHESASYPEDRMEQWKKQHADANGKIPFDGLLKAKAHVNRMSQTKDAGIWNWEWLGPSNIGGRVRAIAIRPDDANIIYLGSATGGLLKSDDAGGSWAVVNDFLPCLSISSIVFDPNDYDVMYMGTGEARSRPGVGIFKSTDAGETWTQLPLTNNDDFKIVFQLFHHPDSSDVLYASVYENGGLWKTIDGGNSWREIHNRKNMYGFKVSPHNPKQLIVSANSNVYMTENEGLNWVLLSNDDTLNGKLPANTGRCEFVFCPSNENRVYLSMAKKDGRFYRSDDKGQNWIHMCDSSFFNIGSGNQGNYDHTLWVDPTNCNHVIVGGIEIWSSIDGGVSFNKLNNWHQYHNNSSAYSAHADQHAIVNHPAYDGINNKTIYVGNDGGIQRNDNVFDTLWTNLAGTSLGITQFYGGAASTDGAYITGGTQDNSILRYKETGTWSGKDNWFQRVTGDGGRAAIDPTNNQIHYVASLWLRIYKTVDGGITFTKSFTGLADTVSGSALTFAAPFRKDPGDPQRLIGGGKQLWQTLDGAQNWQQLADPVINSKFCTTLSIARLDPDIVWAGYEHGTLNVSTNSLDAAPVWDSINAAPLPARYVTDICISPHNSQEVFVSYGGFNADNLWYTPDGGSSWVNRSGTQPNNLPAIQVNTITIHPRNPNWIYVGTDIGVFASEDKGQTWSVDPRYDAAHNEIPANVEVHELFWQGSDYLIAATHGRGLFRAMPLYTLYVDKNAVAGGNGTVIAPYRTVLEAANAAGPGAIISIQANTYDENNLLFRKKTRVITTNGTTVIK